MEGIQALVIPAHGKPWLATLNAPPASNLSILQEIVGGWIEGVGLTEDLMLYCNEEGKLQGFPFNETATQLVRVIFRAEGLTFDDVIAGDVVLVGGVNEDGDDTGFPEEWVPNFIEWGVWPEEEGE